MKENLPETPNTVDLRPWVVRAITETGQKPAAISRAIGASVNLVGNFLRDPDRGITLDHAANIERHLRSVAAEAGKDLPPVKSAQSEKAVVA